MDGKLLVLMLWATTAAAVTVPNNDLRKMLSTEVMSFAVNTARILHNKSTLLDNIIFSPINVYAALSLSHLAAVGTTREEFADILDWPRQDRLALNIHKNFGRLLNALQQAPDNRLTAVKVANGVFVDLNCILRPNFKQLIKKYYQSGEIYTVDFANYPVRATEVINQWISQATEGDISQFFPQPLHKSTSLVLVNTLYFNGRWAQKFPIENTKLITDFSNYGHLRSVNMMNHVEYLPYINETSLKFEAIAKPYEGGEYAMVYFNLYDSQDHVNLSDYLSASVVQRTILNMQPAAVNYSIPRVKFTYISGLKEALETQGLTGVFENSIMGNMIESGPPMKLAEVYHGIALEMDEEGTHAGAIEAPQENSVPDNSISGESITFYVKTPFIICLWHTKTSNCLFFGYIHQPDSNFRKIVTSKSPTSSAPKKSAEKTSGSRW